jgi:hypothetical protein
MKHSSPRNTPTLLSTRYTPTRNAPVRHTPARHARRTHRVLAVLIFLAVIGGAPASLSAQLGVGGRIGTLGLGAEGAIALSDRFVLRGGAGISKLEANTSFDGVPVTVELPDRWYNVGIDWYLNSAFRLGGGIVFKPNDPVIRGAFDGPVDIGGTTLTPAQIGTMTGSVVTDNQAGYFLLGFGNHTADGVGLFIDAGAAILGTPTVTLSAEGGTYPPDQLEALLGQEAMDFEADMKTYLKVWPILSLGLRIGIGY